MELRALVLAVWVAGGCAAQTEEPPRRVYSVCEVMERLGELRGRVVAVRARLISSDEGAWLIGDECAKPLVTNGYTWRNPASIHYVIHSSDYEISAEDDFVLHVGGPSVEATFLGRLESREHYEIVNASNGRMMPYGYGHLSASPAELDVWAIRDARKVRRESETRLTCAGLAAVIGPWQCRESPDGLVASSYRSTGETAELPKGGAVLRIRYYPGAEAPSADAKYVREYMAEGDGVRRVTSGDGGVRVETEEGAREAKAVRREAWFGVRTGGAFLVELSCRSAGREMKRHQEAMGKLVGAVRAGR